MTAVFAYPWFVSRPRASKCRVGRQRGAFALFCRPLPRTVLAPFSAHGSPVSSRVQRCCPASRAQHSSPFCTPCSPSPCTARYSDHLSTMGTPSPCVSRRVGDPVFACVRRSSVLQVSLSSPSTPSFRVPHHRQHSVAHHSFTDLPYSLPT